MSNRPFAQLQAAAIDGRTRTVFYRQTQLEKLHKSLVSNASEIVDAIVADAGLGRTEAQIEYSLALTAVRERFAELEPKKELENEYAIARGEDAGSLRLGYGTVYIKASADHTPFYSAIAPLSAAIAAGNCVVLQIENSLRSLPAILRNTLKSALDNDTFDIAQQPVQDASFLSGCLQVVQDGSVDGAAAQNQLVSKAGSITAAIVDRTANLDETAKALVNARFSFNGKSPYAPDVIFINEFTKKDFLQALLKHSVSFDEVVEREKSPTRRTGRENGIRDLISSLQKDGSGRVIAQESNRAILEVTKRSTSLLRNKISEPVLLVHSVKSLDDAIDFINNNGNELLAAYHFGENAQCKYLSQFVSSQVSYVNHIPAELLVGPAFPVGHPVTSTRYPTALFTRPTPAFVTNTTQSKTVESALNGASKSEKSTAVQTLYRQAVSDLPAAHKRPKQLKAAFGFFEQSMLFNLGFVLLSTGATIAATVILGKRARAYYSH
ncbi:aldehyde dehydrogenase PutA [Aureobasidium pullulans]|uniref:Aldehyde dehydrogenase PutA n=1 Tax=Aureobasidium pullulans TaxID=5580 RepID=A0A4S9T242_AURPU|nr:aldehyde dehydrogenase PutA [Aureobasidium pullulans]